MAVTRGTETDARAHKLFRGKRIFTPRESHYPRRSLQSNVCIVTSLHSTKTFSTRHLRPQCNLNWNTAAIILNIWSGSGKANTALVSLICMNRERGKRRGFYNSMNLCVKVQRGNRPVLPRGSVFSPYSTPSRLSSAAQANVSHSLTVA